MAEIIICFIYMHKNYTVKKQQNFWLNCLSPPLLLREPTTVRVRCSDFHPPQYTISCFFSHQFISQISLSHLSQPYYLYFFTHFIFHRLLYLSLCISSLLHIYASSTLSKLPCLFTVYIIHNRFLISLVFVLSTVFPTIIFTFWYLYPLQFRRIPVVQT